VADPIRFYMDVHVPMAVTKGLRRRGIDVLTAQEAGLAMADDVAHIQLARQQHRLIVTQDADFLRHHHRGIAHSGIAFAPQGTPIGRILGGLLLIREVLSPQDMAGRVEYL
jgi:hypothetical protein